MLILPHLLLIAAAAPTAAPVGSYRLTGEPDVASELVLQPDGHFQYMLAAGALDERAEGRWTTNGHSIWLTTEPKPQPAVFSAGPAGKSSEAPLAFKVQWPNGRGIAGVDFVLGFEAGDPIDGYTQEDGWVLEPTERRRPTWVQFSLAMYGLESQRFPIDARRANSLTFTLEPHDLGIVDFEKTAVDLTDDGLVMHRGGGELIYVAENP